MSNDADQVSHFIVGSRLRDINRYPDPFDFKILFNERIKNVTSIDLVAAIIPNTVTTVNQYNQWLDYTDADGDTQSIQVPIGNYDPAVLLNQLGGQLPVANFVLDSDTGFVTISATSGTLGFNFASGIHAESSIHRMLGFINQDISPSKSAKAQYVYDPPPPPYVTVHVDELPYDQTKRAFHNVLAAAPNEQGRPQQVDTRVVALIPLDNQVGTNKYYHARDCDLLQHKSVTPFELSSIGIKLYDDKGVLFDTAGYETHFEFRLTFCSPPRMMPRCSALEGPIPRD
jgi:hypothetical protein